MPGRVSKTSHWPCSESASGAAGVGARDGTLSLAMASVVSVVPAPCESPAPSASIGGGPGTGIVSDGDGDVGGGDGAPGEAKMDRFETLALARPRGLLRREDVGPGVVSAERVLLRSAGLRMNVVAASVAAWTADGRSGGVSGAGTGTSPEVEDIGSLIDVPAISTLDVWG
jgi:hypothetical protein